MSSYRKLVWEFTYLSRYCSTILRFQRFCNICILPSVELKTNIVLNTYTGQPISVKGSITVIVDYGQQYLKLFIVHGLGPSLMG